MASLKERLKKQREQIKKNSEGYKFFRITEGTTRMRIMPVEKEKDFALEATVFFLGQELGYVVSPITFNGKCAIMKAYNTLSASKDEKDRKFAKNFKPGKKYFTAAGKYKDEKGKEPDFTSGIKLLMLAGGQYQDMIDLFLDEDEAGDFTNPTEGYDLKFGRTGKTKQDTEYSVRACKPTKCPIKWAKAAPYDPEKLLREITPSYEETKALIEQFLHLTPDDGDDKPAKKKKKKPSKD